MSSPLMTVTTAGLSFKRVAANDATWLTTCDSSLTGAAVPSPSLSAPAPAVPLPTPAPSALDAAEGLAASVAAGGSAAVAESAKAVAEYAIEKQTAAEDTYRSGLGVIS